MDNATLINEIVVALKGKTLSFARLSDGDFEDMVIVEVRRKGGCNLIIVGESLAIGFFAPLALFSVVATETEEGWAAGDLIESVLVDGVPFHQFVRLLVNGA